MVRKEADWIIITKIRRGGEGMTFSEVAGRGRRVEINKTGNILPSG